MKPKTFSISLVGVRASERQKILGDFCNEVAAYSGLSADRMLHLDGLQLLDNAAVEELTVGELFGMLVIVELAESSNHSLKGDYTIKAEKVCRVCLNILEFDLDSLKMTVKSRLELAKYNPFETLNFNVSIEDWQAQMVQVDNDVERFFTTWRARISDQMFDTCHE